MQVIDQFRLIARGAPDADRLNQVASDYFIELCWPLLLVMTLMVASAMVSLWQKRFDRQRQTHWSVKASVYLLSASTVWGALYVSIHFIVVLAARILPVS